MKIVSIVSILGVSLLDLAKLGQGGQGIPGGYQQICNSSSTPTCPHWPIEPATCLAPPKLEVEEVNNEGGKVQVTSSEGAYRCEQNEIENTQSLIEDLKQMLEGKPREIQEMTPEDQGHLSNESVKILNNISNRYVEMVRGCYESNPEFRIAYGRGRLQKRFHSHATIFGSVVLDEFGTEIVEKGALVVEENDELRALYEMIKNPRRVSGKIDVEYDNLGGITTYQLPPNTLCLLDGVTPHRSSPNRRKDGIVLLIVDSSDFKNVDKADD